MSRERRTTYYETLDVDASATAQRIERAYAYWSSFYGDDALATYSLLSEEERRHARARVQEAYAVLHDVDRRRAYDREIGLVALRNVDETQPASMPVRSTAQAVAGPDMPVLRHDPLVLPEPLTGAALRRHRESVGVTLQQIAAATKIGVRFLEYIESERFSFLPAPVYLRGFLQEYARLVGLDPRRTSDAYMARVPKSG